MNLNNKKVLQMGLGVLGGGVATARFLVEKGAILTITDLKNKEDLKVSTDKLLDISDKINFVLGSHREEDFLNNDIIVVNPDVSLDNHFVKIAIDNNKQIENELSLFFKFSSSKNLIGITGTRGKTTTTSWTAHILGSKIVGNSPDSPFLSNLPTNQEENLVLEIPSYHLEIFENYKDSEGTKLSPHISLITNIYRDHLNRHKSMENYAKIKSNIFKYQNNEDYLILNKDNSRSNFFVDLKPKSKILFFSKDDNFDFVNKEEFVSLWGEHNLSNLYSSIIVAKILGLKDSDIKEKIKTLPQIKFREERVFKGGGLEIYNDTAATSPEATVAILERFKGENIILITGGTDKDLEFKDWADKVKLILKPDRLILLSGSATEKMKKALDFESFEEFENLEECFVSAIEKAKGIGGNVKILFSPGSKSFEKFKNEFDRGEKFNVLIKNIL